MKVNRNIVQMVVFVVGACIFLYCLIQLPLMRQGRPKNYSFHNIPLVSEFFAERQAKNLVREELNDPDSAQFRHMYYEADRDGNKTVCGQVNAKNAFGAMAGFQNFYASIRKDGTQDVTIVREPDASLDDIAYSLAKARKSSWSLACFYSPYKEKSGFD